jgi:integrase
MKPRKRVLLPIHQELLFALEVERDRRNPKPEERVLLNPATGKPLTRPRLYHRMLSVGRAAGYQLTRVPDKRFTFHCTSSVHCATCWASAR